MALADQFHREMLAVYDECAKIGYKPIEFRRMVLQYRGVQAAKRLIHKPETSGLALLAELGCLDLSMERLMTKPEYADLFTDAELTTARFRLRP